MESKVDWEELVDLYVDGECSEEEIKLVEAKAESDASIRASIEAARRISKGLAELRVSAPAELDARIQRALAEQGQAAIASQKAGGVYAKPKRLSRALLNSRVVGTCAAALVVGVGVVAGVSLKNSASSRPSGVTSSSQSDLAVENRPADRGDAFIFIPSPAGKAPESVAKQDSQDAFWTVVNLNEPGSMKKQLRDFQRLCGELNIKFTKSGTEGEYSLSDVSVEQWKKISDELEKVGGNDESNALKNWRGRENKAAKAVRVLFNAASKPEAKADSEQAEKK